MTIFFLQEELQSSEQAAGLPTCQLSTSRGTAVGGNSSPARGGPPKPSFIIAALHSIILRRQITINKLLGHDQLLTSSWDPATVALWSRCYSGLPPVDHALKASPQGSSILCKQQKSTAALCSRAAFCCSPGFSRPILALYEVLLSHLYSAAAGNPSVDVGLAGTLRREPYHASELPQRGVLLAALERKRSSDRSAIRTCVQGDKGTAQVWAAGRNLRHPSLLPVPHAGTGLSLRPLACGPGSYHPHVLTHA